MKKITSIFLAFILLITFTACDNSTNISENISENDSDESSESQSAAISGAEQTSSDDSSHGIVQSGDLKLVFDFDATRDMQYSATSDGVYLKNENVSEEFNHISYIDFESAQEVVLCADSACKHDNEKCTAVLSYDEFYPYPDTPYLFVYGDYLYLLNIDADDEGAFKSAADNNAPAWGDMPVGAYKNSLYRMNPDGTGREKLFDFPEGSAVKYDWWVEDNPVIFANDKYAFVNTGSTGEKQPNGSLLNAHDTYALIPLEDLRNGRENVINIKRLEDYT